MSQGASVAWRWGLKGFVFGAIDDFLQKTLFKALGSFLEFAEGNDEVNGGDIGFDGELFFFEFERRGFDL